MARGKAYEKPMTPTEQDKELREQGGFNEQLTAILAEHIEQNVRNGMRFGAKQEREKIAIFPFSIDEPVGELRDAIMQLATADRKRVALEARIDELQNLKNAHSITIFDEYLERRLADLREVEGCDESTWGLEYCKTCIQMTNHDDDGCLKCRASLHPETAKLHNFVR